MNDVITMISTVGFPIVMCLLQWFDKRTISKDNTEALNRMENAIIEMKSVIVSSQSVNTELVTILKDKD